MMAITSSSESTQSSSQSELVQLAHRHAHRESVKRVLREVTEVKACADMAQQKLENLVNSSGRALAGHSGHRVVGGQTALISAAHELGSMNSQYAMLLRMLATVLSAEGVEVNY